MSDDLNVNSWLKKVNELNKSIQKTMRRSQKQLLMVGLGVVLFSVLIYIAIQYLQINNSKARLVKQANGAESIDVSVLQQLLDQKEEDNQQQKSGIEKAEEKRKRELAAKEAGEKRKRELVAAKEAEEKRKRELVAAKKAEKKRKQELAVKKKKDGKFHRFLLHKENYLWLVAARYWGRGSYYPIFFEHNTKLGIYNRQRNYQLKILKNKKKVIKLYQKYVFQKGKTLYYHYKVRKNDTWKSLSIRFYGQSSNYDILKKLNGHKKLKVGKRIVVFLI